MYIFNLGVRFQTIADVHANETAIWLSQNETVSYEKLNRRSNKFARRLIYLEIKAGDVVCIQGNKSLDTFALMMGCLKIGAPYSILDPDSPAERLRKMLVTCRPKLLFGDRQFLNKLGATVNDLECKSIDSEAVDEAILNEHQDTNLSETTFVTGSNPAYIMFTSGSTGFPKGAVMTHANVLNLIGWSEQTFAITPSDRLTNVNPLFFDNSVFDFYSALFTGAALVPFTKAEVTDPKVLVDKIAAASCTLWFSVPSLLIFLQTMRATDGRNLSSIRRFVFGGEGYPKAKLRALFESYPNADFFNVYGPTECTCICSCYKLSAADFDDLQGLPPLGRMAENFSYLILDERGTPVPGGEIGELCLLGPNVGIGYYNDPHRTATAFVQNPQNQNFKEVIYKTGDMVRLDPHDGKIHIQGRKDNQIKHMGYRIEIEEIEAALNCLDYVSEAAVMHTSQKGMSRIVAVIASANAFDDDRIRKDLKQIIPDYMIPAVFYSEKTLPKNPNGKIDRQYLAAKYLPELDS